MFISQWSCHATTGRSFDETFHNQEWFIDIFHRTSVFSYRRCYRTNTHRASFELVNYSE